MNKKTMYISALFFAIIIVLANYTVQFAINDWLTYGALLFPFSFLMMDILSEKYNKEEVIKVVKIGIILAIIPTIYVSDWRIAFASIGSYFIVQQLNVSIFSYLKQKYYSLWWLRNNASTLISQLFDTTIFFLLAFSFIMPFEDIFKLIIGDYIVKVILTLSDSPLFYLFAIKLRQFTFSKI